MVKNTVKCGFWSRIWLDLQCAFGSLLDWCLHCKLFSLYSCLALPFLDTLALFLSFC